MIAVLLYTLAVVFAVKEMWAAMTLCIVLVIILQLLARMHD